MRSQSTFLLTLAITAVAPPQAAIGRNGAGRPATVG
jgi:hypothetical protein